VLSSGWFEFSNTAVRSPTLRVLFGLAIAASVETDWHLPGVSVFTGHVLRILVSGSHVLEMFGDIASEGFAFSDPCSLLLSLASLVVVLPAMVSTEKDAHSSIFVAFGVSAEKAVHSLVFAVVGVPALVSPEKETHSLSKVVVALGVPGMISATALSFFGSLFLLSSLVGLAGNWRGEEVDTLAVVVVVS